MPANREVLVSDGATRIEEVGAPSHRDWGVIHTADVPRVVLPGSGEVDCRSQRGTIFVDALTAFRLDAGEAYQLRHDRERRHLVICNSGGEAAWPARRAWLVRPVALFAVGQLLARLRKGDLGLKAAAVAVFRALQASASFDPAGETSLVLRARRHLASRVGDRMSVQELGEEVGCSPFHLTRLFRSTLGVTPHQYRVNLRIAIALRRLEDGAAVADLAYGLGFSSQSHFGDMFRQKLGCTPIQARAALR